MTRYRPLLGFAAVLLVLAGGYLAIGLTRIGRMQADLGQVQKALEKHRTAKAMVLADDLAKKYPRSQAVAVGLGGLLEQYQLHEPAIRQFERAWKLSPNPKVAESLAFCKWRPGTPISRREIDEIRGIYDRGLARWPEDPGLLNDYAYFLAEMDLDPNDAVRMARQAIASSPTEPAVMDTLAWALYKRDRRGDLQAAYKLQDKALQLDNGSVELREHLITICRSLGNNRRADMEESKLHPGKHKGNQDRTKPR